MKLSRLNVGSTNMMFLIYTKHKSDPTRSIVVIRVNFFQTELMVEICSKSLVRAIGKILLIIFS